MSSHYNRARRTPPIKRALLAMIRFYQRYVSPLFPPSCIYEPTCSAYAFEAISRYGALKGSWLAFRRILRCNPFHKGGFDPVPKL
ncbi:MAG: membrane protein insertion efficiency factor YidD [Parafannyhessea sp.]|uniref:membrane protein insertion efficiency factor YidD n=1 Tax=Parafannyhessea sp. TaxID=2847324 RepID=UPI003F07A671